MSISKSTANTGAKPLVQVAVGIIRDGHDRILIAQRAGDSHQGGKWEFPGGKIESGEQASAALKRELLEEVGISVNLASPFMRIRHGYPDREVLLHVFRIIDSSGEVSGTEGQPIKWVSTESLSEYPFPQANLPILRALSLPGVYAISASKQFRPEAFYPELEQVLKAGIRLVQLRAHELTDAAYRDCAGKSSEHCRRYGARLLLNREPQFVDQCGADGIHLSAAQLLGLKQRPLAAEKLVTASCHNKEELQRAEAIGADFVVLSPVQQTRSHPDASPLGWKHFEELCCTTSLPVYALGGMRLDDLGQAYSHGAIGVAMVSGLWGNA